MSDTIRDQAVKAALSILASQKKIAFVQYRYGVNNTDKKDYIAKVTIQQMELILDQQKRIEASKQTKMNSSAQQTIDGLLSSTGKIGLGAEADQIKYLDSIYGVVFNAAGAPSIVEILSIFPYSQLAGVTVPLDQIKYLQSIVDPRDAYDAILTEQKVVDAITSRIQESFTTQFAQNLLGNEGYNSILGMLDKPKDSV